MGKAVNRPHAVVDSIPDQSSMTLVPSVQTQPGIVYQFGPFEVNPASGELLKNGRRIRLQEQPYRLLVALLENAGEVISREELRSRLWASDTFVILMAASEWRWAS
jgi:DNA-binding response OmpR family regulator